MKKGADTSQTRSARVLRNVRRCAAYRIFQRAKLLSSKKVLQPGAASSWGAKGSGGANTGSMNSDTLKRNLARTLSRANIVSTPLPLCPVLKLYLIDPETVSGPFSGDEIRAIQDNPPYWALCWPGGHALADYILRNREAFKEKEVLDVGSGSGVAGIAAALAGARRVVACDMDRDAHDAIRANAALNHVRLRIAPLLSDIMGRFDLLLAADVFYDRDNVRLLERFLDLAPEVLVAESRGKPIHIPPYRKMGVIEADTLPNLEIFDFYGRVSLYRALRGDWGF